MALAMTRAASAQGPHLLVERDGQLEELRQHLGAATGGAGRLVLIRGEAGIGKTSLVGSFLGEVGAATPVLAGACDGVSTPRPFGPLYDMVGQLGSGLAELLDSGASRHPVAAWLTERLAGMEPHVMVIEDLQWADDATLELLVHLARRTAGTGTLALATYREDEATSPSLRQILGILAGMPSVRQIVLAPLTAQGVAQLAAGTSLDAVALHRLTAGNPFFVSEVLAAGDRSIPVSVRDAIRARLSRLDDRARRAIGAAAIIGARVEPWLLAAVAGEDVLGIDDCLAAGLLSKADGIAFRHELTRLTVLEDLPVFQGIGLHRRSLDALRQAGSTDDARLAYHAEGAAAADAVLEHAVAAGDRAQATGANREAAAQFERAQRFADGAPPEVRAAVLERVAFARFLVNEITAANEARRLAADLRRSQGDLRGAGDNLRYLAYLAWIRGDAVEGWRIAEEAVSLLEPLGESRELAMAWSTLGQLAMIAHRAEEARAWSERALAFGRRFDDAEVVAHALNNLGAAENRIGRMGGEQLLLESLRIANEANLPWHVHRALYNLAGSALENRNVAQAQQYYQQLIDYTSGVEVERCSIDAQMASVMLELGRLEDAEVLAKSAMGALRSDSADRGCALVILSRVSAMRGNAGHDRLLADAEAFGRGYGDLERRWPIAAARAEAAWLAGPMDAVVAELESTYAMARQHGAPWAIGDLGRWLWRAGRLRQLDPLAATPYTLQVAGDWRGAMAEWERREIPYEAAICLADSNDPADLREAHERLAGLGASAAARRVALKLRDIGAAVPRGPRPSTRRHAAGLTAREAEIAELAGAGLTNREIAQKLVLTEKTVSHHVSAVLGKLGVRRRADIQRRLARLQPEPEPAATAI